MKKYFERRLRMKCLQMAIKSTPNGGSFIIKVANMFYEYIKTSKVAKD
jgi:hypothetical protein